jgi:hypothetical protein
MSHTAHRFKIGTTIEHTRRQFNRTLAITCATDSTILKLSSSKRRLLSLGGDACSNFHSIGNVTVDDAGH